MNAKLITAPTGERQIYHPPLHQLWHPVWKLFAPVAGTLAALALAVAGYFAWWMVALMLILALLTGWGISIGFHRYFTHRSFTTFRPVAWLLAVFGLMAGQFTLIGWVIAHRRHHRFTDCEGDPHSPHAGASGTRLGNLWHAHAGWLFLKKNVYDLAEASDWARDPAIMWLDRLWLLWYLLGLALPAGIGFLIDGWMGAVAGLLWGGFARLLLVQQLTFIVNSIGHTWGRQDFPTHDESRNSLLLGLLALGDGWHNNHHAFPASARHGLYWWQPDLNWVVIRTLQLLGLAWDVRLVSEEAILRRRASPHAAESATDQG